MAEDRMLNDEILLGLINKKGGGVTDYDSLTNRPKIGGNTLTGDKSASDLGLQEELTAGEYININNDEISVKRDISKDVDAIIEVSFAFPDCTITKTMDGVVVDTVTFGMFGTVPDTVMDVYSVEMNQQAVALRFTNIKQSKEHAVGYEFYVASYASGVVDTQTFVETLDADKKLIIQSELDSAVGNLTSLHTTAKSDAVSAINEVADALADKADTDMVAADFNAGSSYTAENYCIHDGKFYKFKNNHSGAWSAADVDEIQIAGELASIKSGLNDVDSEIQLHVRKDGGRAWPGTTLTFAGISSDTSRAWHFVAIMGNNTGGGAAQEGYITCSNNTTAVIWNKTGDWTASYSNNTLTITLPYSTYWVYRLERAATMNG